MFNKYNPAINAHMQANSAQMCDGIIAVVLTIKMPHWMWPKMMDDYRANKGDSQYLFGFKRKTYEYLRDHGEELYDDLMELWMTPKKELGGTVQTKDGAMMMRLLDVPGLGLAKAGFVMQMMFCRVGCMDVHNVRRLYKVDIKDVSISKGVKSDSKKFEKIMNYVNLFKGNRTTQKIWDSWCAQVMHNKCNRGRFASADDVSRLHLTVLTGE